MNKTPDNRDFEDLFRVYTESSCAFNKKVEDDEEEKDEKETVKEELEDGEDDEKETVEESSDPSCEKTKDGYYLISDRLDNGDLFKRKYQGYSKKDCISKFKKEYKEANSKGVVKEGVFDRVKDRIGSATDALKGGFETFKTGKGQGFNKKYESGKRQRMLKRHMDRIDKILSELATDAVKLGLMDDDEAESVASKISNIVKKQFRSENYGKDF